MIVKLDNIDVYIPAPDCVIDKINELIDAVNGILDYAPLEMAMKAEPKTRPENVQPDAESRPENVQKEALTMALETELDRTRKALDVSLDWLEQVATPAKCDDELCCEFTKRKLAEIKTALEQKEEQ